MKRFQYGWEKLLANLQRMNAFSKQHCHHFVANEKEVINR